MRILKLAASVALIALLPVASPNAATDGDTGNTVTLSLVKEIYDKVKADYVEPVSDKQLVEGAVKGMLASLDPHSGYMDAKEYGEMMVQTRGEFGGLGMEVTMENGAVKVVSPIDDTPAARAGMKPNDLILAIDGNPVTDMTLSQAVDKLRGPIGSQVKITVRREAVEPFELTLTRAEIKVDPVKSKLEDGDIAYVRISSFSERTGSGVEQALRSLKQQSGDKLIGVVLDLRNNPGGLLDQAISTANDFLDQGGIVSIKGRLAADNRRYDAQPNHDVVRGLPVVVLINGGSASASEIVAGALQDDHRAVLLGTRSFGKGSVQTVLPVRESGGAIRLTTALYYTPSGRSIQAEGIEPDVVVQPAKVEQVAQAAIRHESDLPGAFKNPIAGATPPAAKPTAPVSHPAPPPVAAPQATTTPPLSTAGLPPGATPVPQPDAAVDAAVFGTPNDYQLIRAIDLLRGVTLFKKMTLR